MHIYTTTAQTTIDFDGCFVLARVRVILATKCVCLFVCYLYCVNFVEEDSFKLQMQESVKIYKLNCCQPTAGKACESVCDSLVIEVRELETVSN